MPDKNDKKYPKLNEALYLDPKSLSSMKYIMETIMLIALATKNEIEEQKITDQNSVMIKRLKEIETFAALSQELWIAFSNQKPVAPKALLEWSNQANRFGDLLNPQSNQVAAHNRIFKLLEQLQSVEAHARVIRKNSAPKHKTLWQKFSEACNKIASNAISSVKSLFHKKRQAEVQEPPKGAEGGVLLFGSDLNLAKARQGLKKEPLNRKAEAEQPPSEIEAARQNLKKSPIPEVTPEENISAIDELDALFAEITPKVTPENALEKIQGLITEMKAEDFLKPETFETLQKNIIEIIKGEQKPGERADMLPMNQEELPKLLQEIENRILSKVITGKVYSDNIQAIHANLEKLNKEVLKAHVTLTQEPSVIGQPVSDFLADLEAALGGENKTTENPNVDVLLDELDNLVGSSKEVPTILLENALFLIDLQMDTLLERMPEKGKLTEEKIKSLLETVKINLYNNLNSDGTVNGLLNEADFERLKAHLKERLKNEAHESDEEINSFLEGVEIEYLLMDQGVSLTPVIPVARTGTSSQPKTNRSDDFDTLYKELKAVDNAKLAPVLFSQNKKDRTSLPMPIIPRVDYETCKNNIIAALKDPAPADSNFKFTNTIRNAIYASLANEFKYGADVLVKRTLSPDDFDKLKSDLRSYFMQFMPEEKPLKGEESEYQLDLPQVREMIKIMNFIDNLSKTLPEEEKLAMQKLQDKSPPARPSVNLSEDNPSHPRRPGSGKI
jgi:hypothetical protein